MALRRIWESRWLLILGVFAILAPQKGMTHGELLIRISTVTQQIQAATNNAQLYLDRGELYREDQNWEAAKSDYDRAAQLNPSLAAIDFCRAKMLDDSGQLDAARETFSKVLARNSSDGEAFIGRARVLVKQGQRTTAVNDFRRGLELLARPQPEYFLELAKTLETENQRDEALRVLDDGIKKFGPIVWLQEYALELELARNNHEAALVRIGSIIQRAPRPENWLAQRGDILLKAGRPSEAQKSFESAMDAINMLPSRMQQTPPMRKLQSRINETLAKITTGSLLSLNAKK